MIKIYLHEHAMQRPGFLVVSGSKTSWVKEAACLIFGFSFSFC